MFYRTSSHLGRLPKKQPFHLVSSLTKKPYLYLSRCKYDLKKKIKQINSEKKTEKTKVKDPCQALEEEA